MLICNILDVELHTLIYNNLVLSKKNRMII